MDKKLYRSRDKVISGVAGGIADYFYIDPTIVRLLWVLVAFMGGTGIIAYIICIVVIPEGPGYEVSGVEEKNIDEKSIKHNNRILGGGILIFLGVAFLIQKYVRWFDFDFMWPLILVAVGVYIIFKNRKEN